MKPAKLVYIILITTGIYKNKTRYKKQNMEKRHSKFWNIGKNKRSAVFFKNINRHGFSNIKREFVPQFKSREVKGFSMLCRYKKQIIRCASCESGVGFFNIRYIRGHVTCKRE
jgi:hypothetical protein